MNKLKVMQMTMERSILKYKKGTKSMERNKNSAVK